MLTSNEDALKAFECFTLVVKCLGLYPPVTCSRKRTLLGYKLCNLLAIAFSATFYGFLLLFHSLDLETIKLGSGSLITSRMHDVYFVSRYLTVLAVLLHSYINQNSVDQLFGSLNEVSSALVTLNTNHASEGSIGYFGTQRFARHLRWLMLVYPLMFVSMTGFVERWLPLFGVQVHAFNLVRFLYFYSYVHLWAQAILTLFLVLSRYIALNNLFRMYFPTSPSAVGNPSEFAICSEKEQINVLKQIKILHDKLNDVVELVNYCFSVQGKRIGILVHKAINCSSSSAVINEVQCCEGANMMLPVCNVPCAWIILILYLSRQLNLFSQQLLHRSPVITCGLFVYDWTLWYTMIGATATYLIILIQFDVSFPNLVNVNATAVYRGST
ncbi:AGAP001117-PC [Anopheles gambiae str. PEST]|uniref:Gustatory receptor n=1 Tax=Anopheles gambiae TaxID=7165 RepID=Q7PKG7_ANOGA|nr:AGAP001117-PC [Anopheles gambiae str. PEST]